MIEATSANESSLLKSINPYATWLFYAGTFVYLASRYLDAGDGRRFLQIVSAAAFWGAAFLLVLIWKARQVSTTRLVAAFGFAATMSWQIVSFWNLPAARFPF